MEVVVDFTKSAQENAQYYFERSKRSAAKAEGAKKSAQQLREKLKETQDEPEKRKEVKAIEKKEWFEKYNWFYTSSGLLAIGGRSADQNEELNSKHFDEADLFFHADVFGASVVILKGGVDAPEKIREEVAQFAGSNSKAWEISQSSVDVYSLKREQVTKSRNSGSLAKGSFVLKGERIWYKNVRLSLSAFVDELGPEGKRRKVLAIVPSMACVNRGIMKFVTITPGNTKKSDAAKTISKKLDYENIDYIMQHLPAGPFSIK